MRKQLNIFLSVFFGLLLLSYVVAQSSVNTDFTKVGDKKQLEDFFNGLEKDYVLELSEGKFVEGLEYSGSGILKHPKAGDINLLAFEKGTKFIISKDKLGVQVPKDSKLEISKIGSGKIGIQSEDGTLKIINPKKEQEATSLKLSEGSSVFVEKGEIYFDEGKIDFPDKGISATNSVGNPINIALYGKSDKESSIAFSEGRLFLSSSKDMKYTLNIGDKAKYEIGNGLRDVVLDSPELSGDRILSIRPGRVLMRGEDVRGLQQALNVLGFKDNNGEELKVDGLYGSNTEEALIKFQKTKFSGADIDGFFGPETAEKLNIDLKEKAGEYWRINTAKDSKYGLVPMKNGDFKVVIKDKAGNVVLNGLSETGIVVNAGKTFINKGTAYASSRIGLSNDNFFNKPLTSEQRQILTDKIVRQVTTDNPDFKPHVAKFNNMIQQAVANHENDPEFIRFLNTPGVQKTMLSWAMAEQGNFYQPGGVPPTIQISYENGKMYLKEFSVGPFQLSGNPALLSDVVNRYTYQEDGNTYVDRHILLAWSSTKGKYIYPRGITLNELLNADQSNIKSQYRGHQSVFGKGFNGDNTNEAPYQAYTLLKKYNFPPTLQGVKKAANKNQGGAGMTLSGINGVIGNFKEVETG